MIRLKKMIKRKQHVVTEHGNGGMYGNGFVGEVLTQKKSLADASRAAYLDEDEVSFADESTQNAWI